MPNNAAERSLRAFALGRKAWLFAGPERGAERAAAMATVINTAKLNDVDPQAWLADVLARIAGQLCWPPFSANCQNSARSADAASPRSPVSPRMRGRAAPGVGHGASGASD